MKARLTFDTAGQGLFYHGELENFRFVYDCGSSSNGPGLSNSIDVYRRTIARRDLQLLLISHLHSDHVSGLRQLLEKLQTRYAVLPYLLPVERLLMAATDPAQEDWYYDFLNDPVTFLVDSGVDKVVLVGRGGNGFPYEDDRGAEPPGSDQTRPSEIVIDNDSFKMPDDHETQNLVARNDPNWVNFTKQDRLIFKSHNGILDISSVWLFRLYNLRVSHDQLAKFSQCLDHIGLSIRDLTANKISDFLKNRNRRRELAHCYDGLQSDLNNTSLLTFHGPRWRIVPADYRYDATFSIGQCIHPPSPQLGYFLTGDLDLNSPEWIEVDRHFDNYFGRMTGILLPHYWSRKSWNPVLLNRIVGGRKFSNWFVSAGIGNPYKHPNLQVLLDVLGEDQSISWSNDICGISEEFVF